MQENIEKNHVYNQASKNKLQTMESKQNKIK